MRVITTALLCLALLTSCYRTHYANFSPTNPNRAAQQTQLVKSNGSWQHFFIWGWIPAELPIDARAECGGAEAIDSIQTRRTFLEGLVAAFAGYYINIYSPWDAAIYCDVALPPAVPPAASGPTAVPPPAPAP